jgi:hypothetical protein
MSRDAAVLLRLRHRHPQRPAQLGNSGAGMAGKAELPPFLRQLRRLPIGRSRRGAHPGQQHLAVSIIIGGHAFVPSITGDTFVPGLIYYTVAFYGLLIIAWVAFEGRRFKGPPVGDEIARRQAEIAKMEAKLEGR